MKENAGNAIARTNRNRVIQICHQKEPEIIEFTYVGYSREEILLTDAIAVDNVGHNLFAASAVRNYVLGLIEGYDFNSYYPFETFARTNSDVGKIVLSNSIICFALRGKEKIIKIKIEK